MKLIHQINLSFGLLLIVILGGTALMIHHVLLDHLIGAQREDMRTISARLATTLHEQVPPVGITDMDFKATLPLVSDIEAIITDPEGNPLSYPNMTWGHTSYGLSSAASMETELLIEASPIPQGTLTLVTPMSKIVALERALFSRLVIVLIVGGLLVFLLSYLITRKLIRPLMKLREQLEKVKERRFADIRQIQAGGEIGVVARTVHEMAKEVDRYIQAQKHFFQNASHELKTPLMSISGYAEGIRDGVFAGEAKNAGLDIILSESRRLDRLVSEMTLLAKLDSEEGIFQPAPVNLNELIGDAVERMQPLLASRGLQLQWTKEGPDVGKVILHTDRDKLLQALLNVLTNATRYAKETIELDVTHTANLLTLTVKDDGNGISKELLPHLFHRFVKGKDGESGLGLAIARAIAERSGGTLKAWNRKEGGAAFSFAFTFRS